jgi:hypothetical protein
MRRVENSPWRGVPTALDRSITTHSPTGQYRAVGRADLPLGRRRPIGASLHTIRRHCERSEAISVCTSEPHNQIATSSAKAAFGCEGRAPRNDDKDDVAEVRFCRPVRGVSTNV